MREIVEIPQIPYSVCLNHDIEYKRVRAYPKGQGNDLISRGLYMQILTPRSEDRSKPQGPSPVIVYSPGGGWRIPLVRYRLPGIVDLAKRGFVVVMIEYRGREYYSDWREAVSDVRSAVRYVTKNAAQYNIDPEKLFLLGDSAGAHLSLMAAIQGEEFDDPNDDLTIPVRIRGVLELFGPTDLVRVNRELYADNLPDHPLYGLMRETFCDMVRCSDQTQIDELLEPAGVPRRINPETEIPPILIAQGMEDMMVPVWCAEELYEKLKQAGKEAELYLLPNARHGDMRFYEKDMLDRYTRFIQKHA